MIAIIDGAIVQGDEEEICRLLLRKTRSADELQSGTYKARKPVRFTITSPKPRDIASITFRDRVYQRSLNDNAVYPTMSKSFN